MKGINLVVLTFFALCALGETHYSKSGECKYIYPCRHKFYKYNLDKEPAEYGVRAGRNAKGEKTYIGFINEIVGFNVGTLTLNPPGVKTCNVKCKLVNNTDIISYLYNDRDHKYEWVDSKVGESVPFGIDIGLISLKVSAYVARTKDSSESFVGPAVPAMHGMFYIDANNNFARATTYQVLTCKSRRKHEKKTVLPMKVLTEPLPDIGCQNNWIEYTGDDAPIGNGVSAGEYDCGNAAYVGNALIANLPIPGRIQVVGKTGFYSFIGTGVQYIEKGSFYLADNPNYNYYWADFNGVPPDNIVQTRTPYSALTYGVARLKVDGRTYVGRYSTIIGASYFFINEPRFYSNFEILVCDPWPKYRCGQEWKKYNLDNAPATDGFSVGGVFIGRSTSKCINGCDYEIGRIQMSPAAGAYVLGELSATEKFDNITAEYLVRNPTDNYQWRPSHDGLKVANALELQKEGHLPFYIGTTTISGVVYVGKVKPGEGLFFVDSNEKQRTVSSYNVLTCTQSDATRGVYEERRDVSWFSPYGCSARKMWSFVEWRCVCRDEFRGLVVGEGAKWDEATCSYFF